jgi:hypothetical protein
MSEFLDRKQIRFKALHTWFKTKHGEREPEGKYEKYILELTVKLGEVYDENHAKISTMHRKGYHANNNPELAELIRRGDCLNRIGHDLRDAIQIGVN